MIVRVKFKNSEIFLFGDSYKAWTMQFGEFIRSTIKLEIERVEVCKDKWVSWGGLKWCSEHNFQRVLNREGCQDGDLDNPNPRIYKNMIFCENKRISKKAHDIVNKIKGE